MDPASAALAFAVAGFQALKLVRGLLSEVRNASTELQALHDRVSSIELLLDEIQDRQMDGIFKYAADIAVLGRLGRRVDVCFEEITCFTRKMQKIDKKGRMVVRKVKWLMKGDALRDLSTQLSRLENTLQAIMTLVISRSLALQHRTHIKPTDFLLSEESHVSHPPQYTALAVKEIPAEPSSPQLPLPLQPPFPLQPTLCHSSVTEPAYSFSSSSHKLKCATDCNCRCHKSSTGQVVPSLLVPYIGHLNVSRRLLHDMRVLPWECNVQTCRRNRTRPAEIRWYPPPWLAFFDVSVQSTQLPVRFSVRAPRLVPPDARVWGAIERADLDGLRALFQAGQASVWDVNETGAPVLLFACYMWSDSLSGIVQTQPEKLLGVIKFLVDAGADPEFSLQDRDTAKRLLFRLSLATLLKYPAAKYVHRVRTSVVALEVCQSTFGMDIMDVVAEALEDAQVPGDTISHFTDTSCPDKPLDVPCILNSTLGITTLEYAMLHMSLQDASQLLRQGADASAGAPMVYAAWRNAPDLVRPLLTAGADVNACNTCGWTALHWASNGVCLAFLRTLVHCAGDEIDWDVRTPEGKTALQVAQESPYLCVRSRSDVEEFFAVLRAHNVEDSSDDGALDMPGMFPTCILPPH